MFKIISTYSRVDGSPLIDYFPEIRHFGAPVHKFRSQQPGFVGFTHELSEDYAVFVGTTIWESEEAAEASLLAESQNEELMAAKNGLAEFMNNYQIANSKEQETY